VINAGSQVIRRSIGRRPNTLIISAEVFDALKEHPEVQDQFKYTSAESITTAMLARYFFSSLMRLFLFDFEHSHPNGLAGVLCTECYATSVVGLLLDDVFRINLDFDLHRHSSQLSSTV